MTCRIHAVIEQTIKRCKAAIGPVNQLSAFNRALRVGLKTAGIPLPHRPRARLKSLSESSFATNFPYAAL